MLMPVPPSRDSRATSSLRIDQQPATTSALVTKWVKPTNINCRETGLRSLVTNNCGHRSREQNQRSHPKITFYGRLHVIACRARLDVPREVVWFLAKLPAVERQRRGTPRGSRALTCFWQAVLGLRWFRDRASADALARDHGIARVTAYRYLDEVIAVLADQAPDLRDALERAEDDGFSHVILDGKIIACDRCKESAVSVRARSSTCGIRARLIVTAATSRPSWPPPGSRCGSRRRSPARCTTSPPPASTPCPPSTRRPRPTCPPWPIPATTAPGWASSSPSGSHPAATSLTSVTAPATPSSVPCAAWANAGSRCSPAAGAPSTTSPPAPAKSTSHAPHSSSPISSTAT